MTDSKKIAYSIINFLKEELSRLTPEACEGIEVAIQCLENAYEIHSDDPSLDTGVPLSKLFADHAASAPPAATAVPDIPKKQATPAEKEQAENLKTEGNNLMKSEKYEEALSCYTKAIELDPCNPVYYCNRAAAYSHLNNHTATINDCLAALKIEPAYNKAYGRLGLAYSSLGMYKEAKASYEKALELEPGNQTYINNLELNEANFKKSLARNRNPEEWDEDFVSSCVASVVQNPRVFQEFALRFVSNPSLMNLMVSGGGLSNVDPNGDVGETLARAGQNLLQQIQTSHPDFLNQLMQYFINGSNAANEERGVNKDQ